MAKNFLFTLLRCRRSAYLVVLMSPNKAHEASSKETPKGRPKQSLTPKEASSEESLKERLKSLCIFFSKILWLWHNFSKRGFYPFIFDCMCNGPFQYYCCCRFGVTKAKRCAYRK